MADKEYTIADLAKYIKRGEATTRGLLRKHGVERDGKSYSWKSQNAMQAVGKKLVKEPATKSSAKKSKSSSRKSKKESGAQAEAA